MSSKDGSYLFLVAAMTTFFGFTYLQSRKPKLTYSWQGNALTFNLSGFGQSINGTINPATPVYVQVFDKYVFQAQSEDVQGAVAAYSFSILNKADNSVVFSQSPTKWS